MDELERRVTALEKESRMLAQQLETNTRITRETRDNVKNIQDGMGHLLDIFRNARGGARLIISLAKFAKWLGGFAVAVAAIWYFVWAIATGHHPFGDQK